MWCSSVRCLDINTYPIWFSGLFYYKKTFNITRIISYIVCVETHRVMLVEEDGDCCSAPTFIFFIWKQQRRELDLLFKHITLKAPSCLVPSAKVINKQKVCVKEKFSFCSLCRNLMKDQTHERSFLPGDRINHLQDSESLWAATFNNKPILSANKFTVTATSPF